MRFVSYSLDHSEEPRFGFLENGFVVDVVRAAIWTKEVNGNNEFLSIPTTLRTALKNWSSNFSRLQKLAVNIPSSSLSNLTAGGKKAAYPEKEVAYYPPVFDTPSFRNFNAFEQHVKSSRKLIGLDIPEAWYQTPAFYFSNHNSLFGHQSFIQYPEGALEFDFGLEMGAYLAEGGKNITHGYSGEFIAGYTIINDWSARDFQKKEMSLNQGPAKGKDFATSVGPAMVTPDELESNIVDGKLSLRMEASVNGRKLSCGNSGDLYHSFGSMIEYASRNVQLKAGDLIGSGTVGTGCILELIPENTGGWLKPGDLVSLSIEGLGTLENRVE